jgi:hypothetical protein
MSSFFSNSSSESFLTGWPSAQTFFPFVCPGHPDEGDLLDREILTTLAEVRVLIAQWRKECNQVRPYGSLGFHPPVTEARMVEALTL